MIPKRGGDAQRLDGFGDVVGPDDRGAVHIGHHMGGNRAADPLHRLRRRHRVDEALARGADQDRQAEVLEFVELGDRLHALLRGLAEADAGIEHDGFPRDAGLVGDVERMVEERVDVGDDADGGIGLVAVVHDDDRHAMLADHAGHVGIALQAPDVVDDADAQPERPIGDLRLHGVDRDRRAQLERRPEAPAAAAPAPPRG